MKDIFPILPTIYVKELEQRLVSYMVFYKILTFTPGCSQNNGTLPRICTYEDITSSKTIIFKKTKRKTFTIHSQFYSSLNIFAMDGLEFPLVSRNYL